MDRLPGAAIQPQKYASSTEISQKSSNPSIKSVPGNATKGLRDNPVPFHSAPALTARSIRETVSTSFINRLYNTLESSLAYKVSKAFVSDFYSTTVGTLGEMYTNIGKALPEVMKFTGGMVGFSAAMTQTAVAVTAKAAEEAGYNVSNSSIDGITPLLATAGIKVEHMSKDDINQNSLETIGFILVLA
ncbi:hypothetical protein [Endozoicomonas ascidiicola]|uniref:hypothetical protein n=1 Tax=Endozoicomonas ascidiicola TaxID=1698521 RepID=UPI0012FB1DDC|nr:hypothetical protein [Endozoicomonas ascidiicola]